MTKPLVIVVTGAAGFIGRAVVACARARGHQVVAVIRRPNSARPEWDDGVTPVVVDLSNAEGLSTVLEGADAVVHLAATISGDKNKQRRDTVNATQKLCTAIASQPVMPRLVLMSSISVYAHDAVTESGMIDENAKLEQTPEKRDVYCQNKLTQEEIAHSFSAQSDMPLTILRPGAVYGPDHLWNAHLGIPLGPVLVQFTRKGQLPVVSLQTCAQAIVKAVETGTSDTINLIDAQPPTRQQYLQAIGWTKPSVVLPWRLFAIIGRAIPFSAKPGLLHPAILQARMMPVRYDSSRMKELLAGEQSLSFSDAMQLLREGEQ